MNNRKTKSIDADFIIGVGLSDVKDSKIQIRNLFIWFLDLEISLGN
jgi:hypothetical protein